MPAVLIVTDRPPRSGEDPGFERRYNSWIEWARREDLDVMPLALSRPGAPVWRRLLDTVMSTARVRRASQLCRHTVVLALNAPHMRLPFGASRSCDKHYDICDSYMATFAAAVENRDGFLAVKAFLTGLTTWFLSSKHMVVYISDKDRSRDHRTMRPGVRSWVLEQAVSANLISLADVRGPLDRIVIPADLSSKHNQQAFAWFIELVSSGQLALQVPVQIYGPAAPALPLPPGVEYCGWASDITDVYAGDTGVFAPNLAGAGVQNKLLEAVAARRPILIGVACAHAYRDNPAVLTFSTRSELLEQYRRLEAHQARRP